MACLTDKAHLINSFTLIFWYSDVRKQLSLKSDIKNIRNKKWLDFYIFAICHIFGGNSNVISLFS